MRSIASFDRESKHRAQPGAPLRRACRARRAAKRRASQAARSPFIQPKPKCRGFELSLQVRDWFDPNADHSRDLLKIRMCVGGQGRFLHSGQAVLLFISPSLFPIFESSNLMTSMVFERESDSITNRPPILLKKARLSSTDKLSSSCGRLSAELSRRHDHTRHACPGSAYPDHRNS